MSPHFSIEEAQRLAENSLAQSQKRRAEAKQQHKINFWFVVIVLAVVLAVVLYILLAGVVF